MQHKKLSLTIQSADAEQISEFLNEHGALSVSYESADENDEIFQLDPDHFPLWGKIIVSALFEDTEEIEKITSLITQQLNREIFNSHIEIVAEQDWVKITQQQFQPIQFGNRFWICPSWCDANDLEGTVLKIDPGLAFGTGTHPTTALCLEWLSANFKKNKTLIDYGCGSGILALAALALGAKQVFAIDHDPQALAATRNNAALNSFVNEKNLMILLPENLPSVKTDYIVANILANPLIELAPKITPLLKSRGTLILSGILEKDIARVIAAYQTDFVTEEFVSENEWARIVLKKK